MSKTKTLSVILILNFVLNIFGHGDLIISLFNSVLLTLLINLSFSIISEKPHFLILLFSAMPLFIYKNDSGVLFCLLGLILLIYWNIKNNFRGVTLAAVSIYLVIASLFVGGIIKFPFSFVSELLIFKDSWVNFYISQMRDEALYLPYRIRLLVFSPTIYLYIVLSKVVGLISISNIYHAFLIVNIYPLLLGSISNFKKWGRSEKFLLYFGLVASLGLAMSRSADIYKSFLFLSPLFIYLMVRGISRVNKVVYCCLFAVSLIIATSP